MSHNFGSDFILSETGDLIISSGGDFLDTDTSEKAMSDDDVPFEGYTCLKETVYNVLISEKRDFTYDIETGANVSLYISQPMNSKFNDLKESIRQELIKDDRIEQVTDIVIEKFPSNNMATISIFLKVMGIEKISEMVFPYNLVR